MGTAAASPPAKSSEGGSVRNGRFEAIHVVINLLLLVSIVVWKFGLGEKGSKFRLQPKKN